MKREKRPAKTGRERAKELRLKRIELGQCVYCGSKRGSDGTETMCRPCAANLSEHIQKRKKEDPNYGDRAGRKWLADHTLPADFVFTPVTYTDTVKEEWSEESKQFEEIPETSIK